MSLFRTIGKGIGTIGGTVIGGGVKLAGQAIGSKWTEEVGDGIKQASTIAMDNAGQFVDGVVKGAYGVVKNDEYYKQSALEDLKDSSSRTVKGIGNTVVYTAKSAGTVYRGITEGDNEKAWEGVKNLGKVAAVSTLAIGVLDFVDGADVVEADGLDTDAPEHGANVSVDSSASVESLDSSTSVETADSTDSYSDMDSVERIETINDDLAGEEHPNTHVPFVEKTVELPNGEWKVGVFPEFDSAYDVTIPESAYLQSDYVHFSYANHELYDAILEDPSLADELDLSAEDVNQLANGETPEGYTWHHYEEPGKLQLVDEETHHETGHTGGRELWGGGSENR